MDGRFKVSVVTEQLGFEQLVRGGVELGGIANICVETA